MNTTPLDNYIAAIVEATLVYDKTSDHRHAGSPVPGDCIRCNVVAALPQATADALRKRVRT